MSNEEKRQLVTELREAVQSRDYSLIEDLLTRLDDHENEKNSQQAAN